MKKIRRKIKTKLLLTAVMSATIGSVVTGSFLTYKIITINQHEQEMSEYYEVKKYINENYYKDVDEEELMDYTIKGLVAGLNDPYAMYMTPEEYKESQESLSGSLTGIGVSVTYNKDKKYEIMEVYKDSPAEKSGIQAGDILAKVSGIDTENMDFNNLISLVRGEEGTDVILTLKRNDKEIECTVTREIINSVTVEYTMLENKTAYIKISSFKEVTGMQYLEAMKSAVTDGAEKLIIDLRNNGGGLLTSCEACLDPLLPEGEIASAEFKDGSTQTICTSDANEMDIPISVLVNENTASAAELFASALRDFDKAKLVGKNTYGKGVMQDTVPLSNGGGLKLTVAKYKTAKSDCYHEIGLAPDYEVDLPENTDITTPDIKKDPQLKKAYEILN